MTSRRFRFVGVCAGDACGFQGKANEESAQQQFVKKIPAAVPDTLFRNCLRVGMIDSQFSLTTISV
jgi:hypothetical protein